MTAARLRTRAVEGARILTALAEADPRPGRLVDELLDKPKFHQDLIFAAYLIEELAHRAAGVQSEWVDEDAPEANRQSSRLQALLTFATTAPPTTPRRRRG